MHLLQWRDSFCDLGGPKIEGRYELTATSATTGKQRSVAFDNIITNLGLDYYFSNGSLPASFRPVVGTGTTPEAATDTTLVNNITGSIMAAYMGQSFQQVAAPDWYGETLTTWQFSPGQVAGNLTEIGLSYNGVATYSRALIKDGGGTPITFTVLPDEYLTINYRWRLTLDPVDRVTTMTVASTLYTWTRRISYWAAGSGSGSKPFMGFDYYWSLPNSSSFQLYNGGTLGPNGSYPAGTSSSYPFYMTSQYEGAYVPGTGYRDFSIQLAPNAIMPAGSQFNAVVFSASDLYNQKIGVSPEITKTAAQKLKMNFRVGISRP